MGRRGLIIDFEYCTGCHACEVACRQEHDFGIDRWGIHVAQQGPLPLANGRWSFHYVPSPTELCDLCAGRHRAGKEPSCVSHCPTRCITVAQDRAGVTQALAQVHGSQRVVFFNK